CNVNLYSRVTFIQQVLRTAAQLAECGSAQGRAGCWLWRSCPRVLVRVSAARRRPTAALEGERSMDILQGRSRAPHRAVTPSPLPLGEPNPNFVGGHPTCES